MSGQSTGISKQHSELLGKLLQLEADQANIGTEISRLKKQIIAEFCPYKKGMFLKLKGGSEKYVRVEIVKYTPGEREAINGCWKLICRRYLQDLSRPYMNDYNFTLHAGYGYEIEIIKGPENE